MHRCLRIFGIKLKPEVERDLCDSLTEGNKNAKINYKGFYDALNIEYRFVLFLNWCVTDIDIVK